MNRHIINSESTVSEALKRLNDLSGGVMTLVVVDSSGRMLGTMTDGDIRRALLSDVSLDEPVMAATHCPAEALSVNDMSVERIRDCRDKGIKLLPVVDIEGRPIELLDLTKIVNRLPLRALIMAGGKGERLRPMTLTVPKPLLEIEGKAIIDYNIESLASYGIKDITVATGYLAEKIEQHFSHPVAGVDVKCVREEKPLGTIGAASLLPPSKLEHTLVMNSDLLTTVSYEEMYLRHIEEDASITIAVIPYQVSVPFAILTTKDNSVISLEEKPSYSYFANAGIYIIDDREFENIPRDSRYDATDLIENAIASGRKVTYYPIGGTWIDVGSPADFTHASELMKHHRAMKGSNGIK